MSFFASLFSTFNVCVLFVCSFVLDGFVYLFEGLIGVNGVYHMCLHAT